MQSNEKIQLDIVCSNKFMTLKDKLSNSPVLHPPEFSELFHSTMDTSDYAIGGYLFQLYKDGKKNYNFLGRKLNQAEVAYDAREKELLAAYFQ